MHSKRITIIDIRRPIANDLNHQLQWLGESLGLFSERDKDRSCFRLFIELIKAANTNHLMTSDELAYNLGLSRATIIHHINKLMESGLVMHEGRHYVLRVRTLSELIRVVQKDLLRLCEELEEAAQKIDGALCL